MSVREADKPDLLDFHPLPCSQVGRKNKCDTPSAPELMRVRLYETRTLCVFAPELDIHPRMAS